MSRELSGFFKALDTLRAKKCGMSSYGNPESTGDSVLDIPFDSAIPMDEMHDLRFHSGCFDMNPDEIPKS